MNRRMRLAAAFLGCVFSACLSSAWAEDWAALKPEGYVSDFAKAIDPEAKGQLEAYCAAVEQSTGAHIELVTVKSLQHEPIADVAASLSRAWNYGPTSVLWLAALDDRRDYAIVGRNLSPLLPESETAKLLREAHPMLAQGQYSDALDAIAEGIGSRIAAAKRAAIPASLPARPRRNSGESIPWELAVGAVLVCCWLWRALAGRMHRIHGGGGFGSEERHGW